jgi:hypothetical protein
MVSDIAAAPALRAANRRESDRAVMTLRRELENGGATGWINLDSAPAAR